MTTRRLALLLLLLNSLLMVAIGQRAAQLRGAGQVERLAVQQRMTRPAEWSSRGPR